MRKNIIKKIIAVAMVAGCLLGMDPSMAYACKATQDCFATGYDVICGRVYGTSYGHQVTDANGYTTWCTVSVGMSLHSIECSGCGTEVHSESRVCFEEHSHKYCQDKNYVCQYGWEPLKEK